MNFEPSLLLKQRASTAIISKMLICHRLILRNDILYSFGDFHNSVQRYDGPVYCGWLIVHFSSGGMLVNCECVQVLTFGDTFRIYNA